MKHPTDTDLDFLHKCNKEELEFLVKLIIEVGGMTSQLEKKANFKLYHPDHTKYVDEIIEEIQRYAGNTFTNLIDGHGAAYREALIDTLRELAVGFDKRQSLSELEDLLLRLGLEKFLENFKTEEDREKFRSLLDNIGVRFDAQVGKQKVSCGSVVMVALFAYSGPGGVVWLQSPASRVVVPAVIYIAKLRQCMKEQGRL